MTTAAWPPCVCNNQPHKPSGLILAQIIPANGEAGLHACFLEIVEEGLGIVDFLVAWCLWVILVERKREGRDERKGRMW